MTIQFHTFKKAIAWVVTFFLSDEQVGSKL